MAIDLPLVLNNYSRLFKNFKNHRYIHLVKKSFVYGTGEVAQRLISVLLLPVYTRYLNPADYGIVGLLGILSLLLGSITMCGLTNGISRYFYYTDKENASLSEIVWSPFIFIIIFSLFILLAVGSAAGYVSTILFDSDQYTYLVILTLITVFINNLASVGRSILIFQEKALVVNLMNIFAVLVNIAFGLFMVVYLKRGVMGMIEAGLLGAAIVSIVLLSITVFRFRPAFSFSMLKKELKFSLPLVLAIFAFWVIDSSDRYILKLFLPLSEVGLYNIGYSLGTVMMVVVGGFTLAWPPYYHKHNRDNEGQRICDSVLKIYLLFASIFVVLLSVGAPIILKIFTTPEFHRAYTVVPWIALAYMLKGPYIIFLMGVLMRNKTSWQLYLEIIAAVVNIGGNIILIPIIGRTAAALTTLVSYMIMCAGAYWMVMRVNPIPGISWRFMLENISIVILALGASLFSNHMGWNYFVSTSLILVTFFLLLAFTCIRKVKFNALRDLLTDG